MFVRALSIKLYEYNRNLYQYWFDNGPLNALERTKRATYTFNVILFNARCHPHRDREDMIGGMAASTVAGEFYDGGNFVVPLLKKQYALRPGGIILINTWLLEHAVSTYKGQRISFVNTIHEDMCSFKEEANAPPPAENFVDVKCPFCSEKFQGLTRLKTHLAKWRR